MLDLTRRNFLCRAAGGRGGVALAQLLGAEGLLDGGEPPPTLGARPSQGGRHHPPRARRVSQLLINGGESQLDLFDPKPEISRRHGQTFDPGGGQRVEAATSELERLLG